LGGQFGGLMKHALIATVFVLGGALGGEAAEPAGSVTPQSASGRVLADFNGQSSSGGAVGSYGVLSSSDSETVYVCRESLDTSEKHGIMGASLRLDYNVASPGAYNGFWLRLAPDGGDKLDATGFQNLTFWVKGDEKAGIPNRLKVELKSDGRSGVYYVGELGSRWKKVIIPLEEFTKQGADVARLNELAIVFEERSTAPATSGSICVDDIALEK